MSPRRCAESPLNGEYSLCGDAFDAFIDDPESEFVVAAPAQSITCPKCCQIIRTVKAMRNPLRPRNW